MLPEPQLWEPSRWKHNYTRFLPACARQVVKNPVFVPCYKAPLRGGKTGQQDRLMWTQQLQKRATLLETGHCWEPSYGHHYFSTQRARQARIQIKRL